ncbi:MAG: hypothetical protein DMF84_22135 [Acidobacteria bacterium]|nr:MAG: hypothetical protein DMF84_22135 [Acidobacteriota bacterium]
MQPNIRVSDPVAADRRHPDQQALRLEGTRLLTLPEVAVHLNCTVNTVRKLIASGQLRAITLSPRTTRIPESSVVALLEH